MNYITLILGFLITFVLMLVLMPKFITYLKNKNINQIESQYALQEFKNKDKTPIMGGLLFVLIPTLVFILISAKSLNIKVQLFVMLSYLLFCSVGFIDDYLVIKSHTNDGLSAKTRLLMEFIYTIILYLLFKDVIPNQVSIPFSDIVIKLPWFIFLPFMCLLYMAEANAVNFTDGMDGLCAGVSFIGLIAFLILTIKNQYYSIAIFIVCVMAGLLGYLFFNFHPAKIFMGDSGSLALGALFASLGILLDKTIALFFIGGVFVIEMFCVVLQQISVRLFHKRVFSYTPIHYAFVIKGYKETRIVLMFYLLEAILAIIGLIIGLN